MSLVPCVRPGVSYNGGDYCIITMLLSSPHNLIPIGVVLGVVTLDIYHLSNTMDGNLCYKDISSFASSGKAFHFCELV